LEDDAIGPTCDSPRTPGRHVPETDTEGTAGTEIEAKGADRRRPEEEEEELAVADKDASEAARRG